MKSKVIFIICFIAVFMNYKPVMANDYTIENNLINQEIEMSNCEIKEVEEKKIYKEMNVPIIDNSFKSYMGYGSITNKNSKQWQLQEIAYTNENGFRMIDNKYLVAIGTFYTKECGDEFKITLESGKEIDVIIGDVKQDIHTNNTHQYSPLNGNMVEFIVDTKKINNMSRKMGDMSYSGLEGKIVKIEKLVK